MTNLSMVLVFVTCMLAALMPPQAGAMPVELKTDGLVSPLGIDVLRPVFSWKSDAKTANWMQASYEILVALDESSLTPGRSALWDSGRVSSSESVNIAYAGLPLRSRQRYHWKVMTWDDHGRETISPAAWFETGLLSPADWKAQWIGRDDSAAAAEIKAVRWLWLQGADPLHVASETKAQFTYHLRLTGKPFSASLHVLSRGSFIAKVNGIEAGHHDQWGAFDREEITSLLHDGDNAIVIDMVSPGTGSAAETVPAALAAAIHLTEMNGVEKRFTTGDGWQARSKESDPWRDAQIVGPIDRKFGIGTDRQEAIAGPDRITTSASLFRKSLVLDHSVRSARLTVTALGAYQGFINGQAVSPDSLLSPGWTDFHKRVLYQTYDVTTLLKAGTNTVGIVLGGGWYSSPMTWAGFRYTPGPNLLRAQLDITFSDGRQQQVVTDRSWKTAPSPITFSEIYGGESYDARLTSAHWNSNAFDDHGWAQAISSLPPDKDLQITAQPDLPINTVISIKPIGMMVDQASHSTIFDMGQNMVGVVRLHVQGRRGLVARLRFAERLKPDGGIYTENLRNADATDTYALSGDGQETWTPAFTFHGFRYVELTFLGGTPTNASGLQTVEGLIYNSLPAKPSIRLTSSSELLNKMNELGAWGQRGNFLSIPTDCPQRDERLGWMGDAGAFWRTGSYNFDIQAFTNKFMLDVVDAQHASGAFTDVSPNILGDTPGAPGWGDAGIFIPYAAWLQYGQTAVVERSWPAMQRWMDFILLNNPEYLRRKAVGNNFGDWLAPDQNTPKDLIGTAYWALCAQEMVLMARALHRDQDADKYQLLYDHIAAAYRAAYIEPDGSVAGNTQTAYLATLFTSIAPADLKGNMVDRLRKDLQAHGDHLTTGFLGTPFLLSVLDQNGATSLAFKLLLSETYPSWGYMVKKGATTWWERWNGDTGDPGMNSYNHYAFGSVMAWVYRRAAGIDTDATGPGFHHLTIQPHFDHALPQLHVEYDSTYGTIISDWKESDHRFTVTIPANTTATISLPANRIESVGSGVHSYRIP